MSAFWIGSSTLNWESVSSFDVHRIPLPYSFATTEPCRKEMLVMGTGTPSVSFPPAVFTLKTLSNRSVSPMFLPNWSSRSVNCRNRVRGCA